MDIYNSNKWVHRPIISFTSHRTELGHFSSEQLPILKSVVLLHIIIMFLYSLVNTFCNQNKITHSTHLSYFRSGCGRITLLFLIKGSRLRCLTTLANRRSSLCVIREEQTKNGCHWFSNVAAVDFLTVSGVSRMISLSIRFIILSQGWDSVYIISEHNINSAVLCLHFLTDVYIQAVNKDKTVKFL